MSEKRFVYEEEHYNFPIKKRIRDTQNNETYIDLEDVCELLNEKEAIIQRLELENENLRKQVKSSETTSDATSNYNAFLESKITTLEKENEQLKNENETLKSNYQREIQSSIDFCNDYSKTNGELLEKIEKLEKENEQLRKQVESSETTSNATSHYNAFLESKITTLEKENEELKQKLENIGLNEKNDTVKMLEGKFFIRK